MKSHILYHNFEEKLQYVDWHVMQNILYMGDLIFYTNSSTIWEIC